MSEDRKPRPGEPWRVRSITSSYRGTGVLRWKPGVDDELEWVIVASDGRSHIGGPNLPPGWELVAPLPLLPLATPNVIDAAHLERQRDFSLRTFGPGLRTKGVVDHITKELREILDHPTDLFEWVDVIILALDGAWRSGASPQRIINAIVDKQARNETRDWPDWRTQDPDKAIEHDRTNDRRSGDLERRLHAALIDFCCDNDVAPTAPPTELAAYLAAWVIASEESEPS